MNPLGLNLRPRPSWMCLTEQVLCLLASNEGDAISGNRSGVLNAGVDVLHCLAQKFLNPDAKTCCNTLSG